MPSRQAPPRAAADQPGPAPALYRLAFRLVLVPLALFLFARLARLVRRPKRKR